MKSDKLQRYFGLSYAAYLAVPRSLLESMPVEWQDQLADLLEQMLDTPGGERFATFHYLVQRTCPERDQQIHEAELHNEMADASEDQMDVPEVLVLDDPFRNYRHPMRSLFEPAGERKPE